MENEKIIKLYTKFCIDCVRKQEMDILAPYCYEKGFGLEIVRTSYNPKLHEEATKTWGGEDYTMFLDYNGKRIDFDYAIEKIRNGEKLFEESKQPKPKSKPVKKGKAK